MKIVNWIKEHWAQPVWSDVFAGLILAAILGTITLLFNLIIFLFGLKMNSWLIDLKAWINQSTNVSNLILVLLILFFGYSVMKSVYRLITKKWLGRTDDFYSSDSSFTVRGTYSVDLDLGIQARGRENSDFFWEQKTLQERSLVPKNGASFCVIGLSSNDRTSQDDVKKLNYSTLEIRADDNQSNQIPVGTQIAYKTKQGRYGLMKILKYGYNLEIEFHTFKTDMD